jgi:ribosomal protein S18 acetylase RimI-like enzyme
MISLRQSNREELEKFDAMDSQAHAREYVIQTGIDTHRQNFEDPGITYLSIEDEHGEFCGYFILVLEPATGSVEFRRILVDQQRRGVGQAAICEMESYCKHVLAVERIWLDVFEGNDIGIYIYEKMGYTRFREECFDGRKLYFYEKAI